MKAVVAAFNQQKALVGAVSMITNLRMELFEALMFFLVIINVGGTITHCPPPGAEDKFWAVPAGLGGSAAHTGRTEEI